jgi:hypothetical protein
MRTNRLHVMRYLSVTSLLLLMVVFVTGCSEQAAPTAALIDSSIENPTEGLSKNNVIHHVSVGSPDIVPPGLAKNFSLVANMQANGTVKGRYTDHFGQNSGFIANVNCLSVNGNEAWVSGVITSGSLSGTDLTGVPVITRVADNGTSGDQISFSFIGDATSCLAEPDLPLFNLAHGQVRVK